MRRLLIAVGIIFFIQQAGWAQAPRRYERSLKRKSQNKFIVYVPQNYEPQKAYPLLIAVHQKGGPAIDQYNQWNFLSNRDHYILLCPQFFGGYELFKSDEDQNLIAMMREMKDEFKYDPQKVFLVGFSTGAEFAQHFIFENPGLITAAAVLAIANYREPPYSGEGRKTEFFVGVGTEDTLRVEPTRRLYDQLLRYGYVARYKEFVSVGHELDEDVKNEVMEFFKTINDNDNKGWL